MSNHAYAFKYNNKTLGIKDVEQLKRLMDSGKIAEEDSVFVLDIKRWVKITNLAEYSELQLEADINEETPVVSRNLELTPPAPQTKAFSKLLDELDDSQDEKEEEIENRKTEAFEQPENSKTIHRVAGTKRNKDRFETMVAAKNPRPERNWGSVTAIAATAIFVLLLGLAAGFFGATQFQKDTMPEKANSILQANTAVPSSNRN